MALLLGSIGISMDPIAIALRGHHVLIGRFALCLITFHLIFLKVGAR